MGDEIGLVISRTSTMRTDMDVWLSEDGKCVGRIFFRHWGRSGAIHSAGNGESGGPVSEIRLDRTMDLEGERIAVAILRVAGGDAHPALADAIFLDVCFFVRLEADG